MPRTKKSRTQTQGSSSATVGYEAQLWQMADALRGSMDAAEYKHVVLGLIFLKCISDAFEEQHAKLVADKSSGADPEDPDEYRAQSGAPYCQRGGVSDCFVAFGRETQRTIGLLVFPVLNALRLAARLWLRRRPAHRN